MYGSYHFQFMVLEVINYPSDLLPAEQYWLEHFQSQGVICYNFRSDANSNLGIKMPPRTAEHVDRLKQSLHDYYATDEGQQAKERMRQTWWQRLTSPQSIRKRSDGHRGVKESPDAVRRRAESCAHIWRGFIAPDGTIYRNIKNLKSFCRDHDLNYPHMHEVSNGKRRTHKGWRRYDDE